VEICRGGPHTLVVAEQIDDLHSGEIGRQLAVLDAYREHRFAMPARHASFTRNPRSRVRGCGHEHDKGIGGGDGIRNALLPFGARLDVARVDPAGVTVLLEIALDLVRPIGVLARVTDEDGGVHQERVASGAERCRTGSSSTRTLQARAHQVRYCRPTRALSRLKRITNRRV
jgi:hypothetical protein